MSTLFSYSSIVAASITAGWFLARARYAQRPSSDSIHKHPPGMEENDPYRLCGSLLTEPEQKLYQALLGNLPSRYSLLAKVRLADLLQVNYGAGDRSEAHAKVSNKSLDFLLCDSALIPRLAICLDSGTEDRHQLRSREFVSRVCTKIGLPIERHTLRQTYTSADALAMLARLPGESER